MEVLLLAIFIGIILGIITGLTPGIHINLVTSIIISYADFLLKKISPLSLIIVITSMSVTHTILDIIPSTLLGIPNTENMYALLPAHKLTLEGKAKTAINYGLMGGAIGIIVTILITPLIITIIPLVYGVIKESISLILIGIISLIILRSKEKTKSLLFFLTTGIIGILSFGVKTIDQPLLPLLSGLFGVSSIILSIKNKVILKEQEEKSQENITTKEVISYGIITTLASFLTNFLPGLTSSHTSLIANKIKKVKKQEEYIILSNATNASATIIGFIAFYSLNKTRSGAIVAIQRITNTLDLKTLVLILGVTLITTSIVILLALKISKICLKYASKINYQKLNIFLLILIISVVILITKIEGILILIISTSIGILAEKLNIEKIHLTGCLILPVIIYTF